MITNLSRATLRSRHRLSHQQIDDILHENSGKEYLHEKLIQLQKLSSFLELTTKFDEQNLWYVVLKGPLLSHRIYGDPVVRIWRDFDFLTKPELVEKFIEILTFQGFEFVTSDWPAKKKRQRMYLQYGKHIDMRHPKTGITVEIHWKLFSDRLISPDMEWGLILDHIEQRELTGKSYNCFTNEFELLYLVIHGSMHAWFRLKWLTDIREMLVRLHIDREVFLKLSKEMNAGRFVCVCNRAIESYFPQCELLPCEISGCGKTGNYMLNQIKSASDQMNLTFFETVKAIQYKMSLSPKLRYKMDVFRLVTFNRQDLKYNFIPPFPVFFYLFRPFGIFLRKFQ